MSNIKDFFLITIFLILICLNANDVAAQDAICGTPTNNVYSNARVVGSSTASGTAIITVNVVFHIVNNVVPESSTDVMINNLNTAFSPHNIRFTKLCVNHIGNVSTNPYDYPYAINVHILDQYVTPYSGGIGANTIYFAGSAGLTTTLPHEMGHCLYLFHTHNERGCLEFIDESNCSTCGDLICDTPSDPGLFNKIGPNCSYIGTATQNGAHYSPDTHNFMSYSDDACRNRFTTQQGIRMYNALTTLDVLIPTTKPPQIQGPSLVCDSQTQTYSFNTSQNSVVTWSSSNPSGLSINSTTGVPKRLNNFNGQVVISAIVNDGCGTNVFTLNVNVGTINAVTNNGEPIDYSGLCCAGFIVAPSAPNPITTSSLNRVEVDAYTTSNQNAPLNFTLSDPSHGVVGSAVNSYTYQFYDRSSSGFHLNFSVNNGCGPVSGSIYFMGGAESESVASFAEINTFPNPAASTMTVQVTDSLSTSNSEILDQPYQLTLYNNFSRTVYSAQSSKKNIHIPLEGIPDGIYYLNVLYKGATLRKHVVVKN